MNGTPWTPDEDIKLMRLAREGLAAKEIAVSFPGRAPRSIRSRLEWTTTKTRRAEWRRQAKARSRALTAALNNLAVADRMEAARIEDLDERLGNESATNRFVTMSITETSDVKSVPYTPSAMERVRKMAPSHTDAAIARDLGWPVSSLRERCIRHGIHIAYEAEVKLVPDTIAKAISAVTDQIKPKPTMAWPPKHKRMLAPKTIKDPNDGLSPVAILAKAGICWDVKASELTSESRAATLTERQAAILLTLLPSLRSHEFVTVRHHGMGRLRTKLAPFGLRIEGRRTGGFRLGIRAG